MSPGTGGLSTESPINSAPSVSPEDSPMSQGGSLNGSPDSFSSLGNNPACSRSRGASFMHSLDEMVLRAKEAQGMSRGSRRSAAPKQHYSKHSTMQAKVANPT